MLELKEKLSFDFRSFFGESGPPVRLTEVIFSYEGQAGWKMTHESHKTDTLAQQTPESRG